MKDCKSNGSMRIQKSDKVQFKLSYLSEGHVCSLLFKSFKAASGSAERLKRDGRVMILDLIVESPCKLNSWTATTHVYNNQERRVSSIKAVEALIKGGLV